MEPEDAIPADGHNYDFIRVLGHGAFGKVFLCRDRWTLEESAVKVIEKNVFRVNIESVDKEIRILSSLHHPNIVQFRRVLETDQHVLIEMELLRGGTLKAELEKRRFSDEESAHVLRGILQAVKYLHSRDIVHRDLKPDNILFESEAITSEIKVTDFGLSEKFEGEGWSKNIRGSCGTLAFMAPEQAQGLPYFSSVDIWSCGIMLYMLVTGTHPLLTPEDNTSTYLVKLKDPQWTFPQDFPPLARDLFERLVAFNPIDRYKAEEALQHPWMTRGDHEIPKTYIERMNAYNDLSRVTRIFLKSAALSVLARIQDQIYADFLTQVYQKKPRPKIMVLEPQDDEGEKQRMPVRSVTRKITRGSRTPDQSPEKSKAGRLSVRTLGRLGVSPAASPKSISPHSFSGTARKSSN